MNAPAALHCYHCDLPVMPGEIYRSEIDGAERLFCCPACRLVAETIVAGGLGLYYRQRTEAGNRPADEADYSAFDDPRLLARCSRIEDDGEHSATLLIGGMHCAACSWLLERQLQRLPGVRSIHINLESQRAWLRWDPTQSSLRQACEAIAGLGYEPQPDTPDQAAALRQREDRAMLRRVGIAGIGMMQVGMLSVALYIAGPDGMSPAYRDWLRGFSLLLATPVVLYSAQPFFSGAWRGLRRLQPGMDVPVALAIGLAFIASIWATLRGTGEVYFDSVTMFTFLLLGGRYLELRARHYGGRIASDLGSLLPAAVWRQQDDGQVESVPLLGVAAGDLLLVKPGQVVPADGIIAEGSPQISEAALTGEFEPVLRQPGDSVTAGTGNGDVPFLLRVTATGPDLRIHALAALMARAGSERPGPGAVMVDRVGRWFVVGILIIAAAVFSSWWQIAPEHAFWVMLSVLVVSCPCALALAAPTALASATRALRSRGLLVTRAAVWEQLAQVSDVIFDKTGTLTRGEPRIEEVIVVGALDAGQALEVAAALEATTEHPLARAFPEPGRLARNTRIEPGQGIEGEVDGCRYRIGRPGFAWPSASLEMPATPGQWLLLADEQTPIAWFRLGDPLRDDAARAVARLRRHGLRLHLVSGDPSPLTRQLGQQLHFDAIEAGASPEHKLHILRELQSGGRRVLMVGDGLNDLPVLAGADVSVAMTGAPDLAKTRADAVMLSPRLDNLNLLLNHAARTRRIMRQNFAWALGYNSIGIPLAAMGLVPPWLAAIGMSASSLLVLCNSLRLQRGFRPAGEH